MKKTLLITLLCSLMQLQSFSQWKSHYPVKKSYTKTKEKVNQEKNSKLFEMHFFNGLKAKSLEDYDQALQHFSKCIKVDAKNSVPFYESALIHESNENYSTAINLIENALKLDKNNRWYSLLYARILFSNNDFVNAAIQYRKLIVNEPNNEGLYFKLSDSYIYSNNFKKAIKVYDELERSGGISKMLSMQKHKLYREINDLNGAISELNKLLEVFPDEIQAIEILSELYLLNDEKDKAFDLFKKLSIISPDNGRTHLTLADYYRENGNNEKSYSELKLAFKCMNLNIDTKVSILISYYQLLAINEEINNQAYELAQILITCYPDNLKARAVFADILYTDNKYQEAKEQYLFILEREKNKSQLWGQVLFIQAEQNDFTGMLKTSFEALEYFPADPLFYYFNGISNKWLKNYNKAIESHTMGLEFVVENTELLLEFYSSLAELYHITEQHNLSDKYYDRALEINPKNALVLNNYSYYLSLRKTNLKMAKEMSLLSNDLDTNNGTYQDTYAWVLYSLNEYEEALIWVLKALSNGSDKSAVVVEHYGDILYQLGKFNKARNQWIKARDLGEGSQFLIKKIENNQLYE